MRRRKHKGKYHSPVLDEAQQERKKARSLGYQNVEEYEKGLSVVKDLLARKGKNLFNALRERPMENLSSNDAEKK